MTTLRNLQGAVAVAAALLLPGAASAASLTVTSADFAKGKPIPAENSFCVPAPQGHPVLGPNKSPKLSWSGAPKGTQSYAIIVVDRDVPSVATDVNKEGKTLPKTLKRINFYHWVLVDIPANVTTLDEGADSDRVTPHGKPPGAAKTGVRGINDYTKWFASDQSMKGNYGGYDGPCPPWNDTIIHHYHFTVYALNVPSLGLTGTFTAEDAEKAMKGHILASGQTVGTYALNPSVAKAGTAK